MARTYLIQSWVGAAEYPDGDQYSGEQIGNRNKPSMGIQIERSGDQWRTVAVDQHFTSTGAANIRAYAESDKPKTRAKTKPKTAFERVNLADAHYSRLEKLSQELDTEYEQGLLSHEDWAYARRQLDKRLDAGWVRVCKVRGWNPAERDEEIFYSLNIKALTAKQQASTIPTSHQESSVSWSDEWLASISDDNIFKRPLQIVLTSWKRAAKMLAIVKQAIKQMEGIK